MRTQIITSGIALAIILIVALSIKTIKQNERVAVFRLGRFLDIKGPGLIMPIPLIDRIKRIPLQEVLPNWKRYSEDEIRDKVKEIVCKIT